MLSTEEATRAGWVLDVENALELVRVCGLELEGGGGQRQEERTGVSLMVS